MPHKRAKRSLREEQRAQKGSDQAPPLNHSSKQAISAEGIPKSVARVLNAAHVRQEWREKKRKLESGEDTEGREAKSKKRRIDEGAVTKEKGITKMIRHPNTKGKNETIGIQPGESLGHFNRRVEDDMRPLVKSAMQSSSAQARKVRKSDLEAKSKSKSKNGASASDEVGSPSPSTRPMSKHDGRPTEFQKVSTSAPRRLNDIAQAHPEFKKLPRHSAKDGSETLKLTSGRTGVLSMKQKLMMEEEREKVILRYRALKERRRVEGGNGGERGGSISDDE